MSLREYECDEHGYFEIERSISAPTSEVCPVCEVPLVRVYTQAPVVGFACTTGGIPDYSKDPGEYSEWQTKQFKKLNEDVHPDNRGKTVVNEASWAPKQRLKAVREGRGN